MSEYLNLLQFELNERMKSEGNIKFIRNEERLTENDDYSETVTARDFASKAIGGFVKTFEEYVEEQETVSRKGLLIKHNIHTMIDPRSLAKIIIKCLLSNVMVPDGRRKTATDVLFKIGDELEYTLKQIELDMYHAKDVRKVMDMLRRQGRVGDKEEIRNMMLALSESEGLEFKDFDSDIKAKMGLALVQLFYKSPVSYKGEQLRFSDIFREYDEKTHTSKHKQRFIDLTVLGREWLSENETFLAENSLTFLPMVVPPMPWRSITKGGYWDEALNSKYHILKGVSRKKVKELYYDHPEGFDVLIEVLNELQSVPFTVNGDILEAVKYVNDNEISIGGGGVPSYMGGWEALLGDEAETLFNLRKMLERDEDGRLTDSSKEQLEEFARGVIEGGKDLDDKELWKEWRKVCKKSQDHARAEKSKTLLMDNVIRDAQMFVDAGAPIYFVYNADYRGRIYPLSTQFSPQGTDVSKGLLNFANPVWVDTDEAVDQIAYVIANNYGEDKLSITDRIQWTHDHTAEILACATDFKSTDFWLKADKPFMFLNGCLEWAKVVGASMSEEGGFWSSIPIAFDGSCNGIQHYSAMFKDPEGAVAVNLVDSEIPSDVYKEVGLRAKAMAERSSAGVNKLIQKYSEETDGAIFGRKVAKRSTMCLPYGVSKRSSNAYVYETVDEVLKESSITAKEAKSVRTRIGSLIWDAIGEVVGAPVVGKEYLQNIAAELAEENLPVYWTTPTGFPVKQEIKKSVPKMIEVKIDGVRVQRTVPRYVQTLDGGDQSNAVAPNFVHSFDSAHLQLTVKAAAAEGMENFLVVHDSFATDANSAARFNEIIREEFVGIYNERDYLNEFHDKVEEQLGRASEVGRVHQGDFDVNEVLKATYFFS
jgi:DNA-directed RNA polymerase